jgi:hypothetical protein
MTEKEILAQLKRTMDQLEENFDDLYVKAKTADNKESLRQRLTAARDAYWMAVDRGLRDRNDFVNELADELADQNAALAKEIRNFKGFVQFLGVATEAVKLAASIAALAATG